MVSLSRNKRLAKLAGCCFFVELFHDFYATDSTVNILHNCINGLRIFGFSKPIGFLHPQFSPRNPIILSLLLTRLVIGAQQSRHNSEEMSHFMLQLGDAIENQEGADG
jgi:hypothetical protein